MERVRRLAYEKWEKAGRPSGRSQEFWFAAEREIQLQEYRTKVEDSYRQWSTGLEGLLQPLLANRDSR